MEKVSLGGLTVVGQLIGVATKYSGFTGYDGIFGFGPGDLTEGTVSGVTEVPTFMDNLYAQGKIVSFLATTLYQCARMIIGARVSRLRSSASTSSLRAARTLPMLTVN